MKHSTKIAPTHKSLTHYYATLKDLAHQNVYHEMGLRRAFQELLAETAKLHGWTLIPEKSHRTAGVSPASPSTSIRPDATLRGKNTLSRRFWEAKYAADSLQLRSGWNQAGEGRRQLAILYGRQDATSMFYNAHVPRLD